MGSNIVDSGNICFPPDANTEACATKLDLQDPLRSFREKFIIPTKAGLNMKQLHEPNLSGEKCIYFCGNSLGLQPKAVSKYLEAQLNTWATIGVHGHFTTLEKSPLIEWQSIAGRASEQSARLVGASPDEVATMGSLTMNLHLLMASFYKPTTKRHKIILEWKAFPSDHYMIESQIRWHGFDPETSMLILKPDFEKGDFTISTDKILNLIDDNAAETALILLPAIQYYSGQLFNVQKITQYAQSKGMVVGWDLAHAAGNVPLCLHDWNVDFAAWCTYKYMNAGPGAIAGLFVHENHSRIDYSQGADKPKFLNRLSGWYGGDKDSRFNMDNKFNPCPGADGWQVSNPSVIDLASLSASLSVFNETSMAAIRQKSLLLTAYFEHLLLEDLPPSSSSYRIITPSNPEERGAQLSILLKPGLLSFVFDKLTDCGYVFDQRKPDVVRIAPVPLYNTFWEVWRFVKDFKAAVSAVENKVLFG